MPIRDFGYLTNAVPAEHPQFNAIQLGAQAATLRGLQNQNRKNEYEQQQTLADQQALDAINKQAADPTKPGGFDYEKATQLANSMGRNDLAPKYQPGEVKQQEMGRQQRVQSMSANQNYRNPDGTPNFDKMIADLSIYDQPKAMELLSQVDKIKNMESQTLMQNEFAKQHAAGSIKADAEADKIKISSASQMFDSLDPNDKDIATKWPIVVAMARKNLGLQDNGVLDEYSPTKLSALKQMAYTRAQQIDDKLKSLQIVQQGQVAKDNKSIALSQKEDQRLNDRASKLSDALDPSRLTRGPFSVSKSIMDRSDRLKTLDEYVNAYQQGNADSRQIEELAIGLNALLSGASQGAQHQVEALVPKSAIGNTKKMIEFLTNNPQGTNQQEFVKRMMGTVQNERNTAEAQIKKTRMQRIAQFEDVKEGDTNKFNNILQSWEIDPNEYDAWKASGFKKIEPVTKASDMAPKVNQPSASSFDDLWANHGGK
jgi:hypothetical protein